MSWGEIEVRVENGVGVGGGVGMHVGVGVEVGVELRVSRGDGRIRKGRTGGMRERRWWEERVAC